MDIGCILKHIRNDDRDIENVDLTIAYNTTVTLNFLSKDVGPIVGDYHRRGRHRIRQCVRTKGRQVDDVAQGTRRTDVETIHIRKRLDLTPEFVGRILLCRGLSETFHHRELDGHKCIGNRDQLGTSVLVR